MAFGFGDFFESAIDFGGDLVEDIGGVVSDIGLEDVATLATTGAALASLFASPKVPGTDVLGAGQAAKIATKTEALIGGQPGVSVGDDEEEDTAAEQATRNRLRVRRTFDPGLSLGGSPNPLGIQI